MKKSIGRLGVAGVAVAALGVWMPISSANAATSSLRSSHLTASSRNSTSTGQAGYEKTTGVPAASTETTKIKMPGLKCTGVSGVQAAGMGSFIFEASTGNPTGAGVILECNGTTAEAAGFVLCTNGTLLTSTWVPQPGNTLVATDTIKATTSSAVVKDVTLNMTLSATGTSCNHASTIKAGILLTGTDTFNNGSAEYPIPNFTKASFSAAKQNGANLSGDTAFDLKSGTDIQIHTGALNATHNGFAEIFQHST